MSVRSRTLVRLTPPLNLKVVIEPLEVQQFSFWVGSDWWKVEEVRGSGGL
jgi:hypothetical protein